MIMKIVRTSIAVLVSLLVALPAWAQWVGPGLTPAGGNATSATLGNLESANATGNSGVCTSCTSAPNILLNPFNAIDQANEGASASLGVQTYLTDGWVALIANTGATGITGQRVSDAPTGLNNSLKITVGTGGSSGATTQATIQQRVEANLLNGISFGTSSALSLSAQCWVKSSVAGTFGVALVNSVGSRSYPSSVTISSANTWQFSTFTISGDTSGAWVTSGSALGMYFLIGFAGGSTFQGTANQWQSGNLYTTSSQTQLTNTTGATFQITGCKLEVSPIPTPLKSRDFSDELALAQRYYRKTFATGTAPAQSAGVVGAICHIASATAAFSEFWHFGSMRAAPTITTYNPSATNANWRDVTASSDQAATIDPSTAIADEPGVQIKGAAAAAAGNNLCIQAVADARL